MSNVNAVATNPIVHTSLGSKEEVVSLDSRLKAYLNASTEKVAEESVTEEIDEAAKAKQEELRRMNMAVLTSLFFQDVFMGDEDSPDNLRYVPKW